MVAFPNCKINIGLHIVGKQADGYHNLETVFYPLPLTDILEVIAGTDTVTDSNSALALEPSFSLSGTPVAGVPGDNLCIKAWKMLRKIYPQLPAPQIHLHKNIPMGAGLGGGSADGAFTLQLINKVYDLGIAEKKLADYALQLGSDCPFFIYNKAVFAGGRGEIFEPVELDLQNFSFLIIDPGIHVSTAQAFARITINPGPVSLRDAITLPVNGWKDIIKNDFEEPAFYYHPALRTVKSWLYQHGAVYASMTGSGSSFFGIFPKNELPVARESNWRFHYLP